MWVITATPVSNPDGPSASLGKTRTEIATMADTLPWPCVRAAVHSVTRWGAAATCPIATAMTMRFSVR